MASITASASAANSSGRVGLGAGRPVRAAVAPPVEGDHAEVAGEIRDLQPSRSASARSTRSAAATPSARRRRSAPRRSARRRARRSPPRRGSARASAPRAEAPASSPRLAGAVSLGVGRCGHGRASNTRLNGVSAARRKRLEAAGLHDVADPRLAGLGAERQPDLLRERRRRAQQRREPVVRAADRVEVVLDAVAGVGLDDHPRAVAA